MTLKTYAKTFCLFSLLFFISVSIASASVTYDSNANQINVLTSDVTNFTVLNSQLNNAALLSHVGKIWYLNASLDVASGGYFYVNDTDVSELRISNSVGYDGLLGAKYKIENVKIGGWNKAQNRYATKPINSYDCPERQVRLDLGNGGWVRNSVLTGVYGITYTGNPDGDIYNLTMSNGVATALDLTDITGINFHDISINNFPDNGIDAQACINCKFYNLTILNIGNYKDPSSGSYSINIENNPDATGCTRDCIFHDLYCDGSGWSSVGPGGKGNAIPSNITMWNGTIKNAGHNGLDLHGGSNYHINNFTICHSNLSTSECNVYCTAKDVWLDNFTMYGNIGDMVDICNADWSRNINLNHFRMYGNARGIVGFDTYDDNLFDCAQYGSGNLLVLTNIYSNPATDVKAIDCDFTKGTIYLDDSRDTILINTGCNDYMAGTASTSAWYYYPNIKVQDVSGNPVEGATITTDTQGKNGYGNDQTTYYTDENGKLYDSGNRSNWLAILDVTKAGTVETQIVTKITASKDGVSNSTSVNPSPSWYSSKQSNLQGPQITLVLSSSPDPNPTPSPILPIADFNSNVTSGYAPLYVHFIDQSENVTGVSWDFDNNGIVDSTDRNPIYEYTTPGVYTVNLTAANENGTNSKSGTIAVSEKPLPIIVLPVADFKSNVTKGTSPLSVQFSDLSTNSTSWSWNFGDGNSSTVENPANLYSTPGNYTVTLKASNGNGTDIKTRTNYISVVAPPPVNNMTAPLANFTASPISGRCPLKVTFTDTSTGNVTSRKWVYGDGYTATATNITHTYSYSGTYTAKLTATNSVGSSWTTKIITVNRR